MMPLQNWKLLCLLENTGNNRVFTEHYHGSDSKPSILVALIVFLIMKIWQTKRITVLSIERVKKIKEIVTEH